MRNISKYLILSVLAVVTLSFAIKAQTMQSIALKFKATVGETPFDCSETYAGIGTSKSKMTISDFRFFVFNVRLVTKNGSETTVVLDQDKKYQAGNISLLDFENGEGNCSSGTKELNTSIRGSVPNGKYTGIKFTVGVPLEKNHEDPTLQPSPLNVTRMMWSWQSGYKFLRVDTKTTGLPNGYVLHLGSTDCKINAAGKTSCGFPNRAEIELKKLDLTNDVVKVDIRKLFAGVNVDANQEKTAAGCMSGQNDADCKPVFESLGISFGGQPAKAQTFFSVEKTPKVEKKAERSKVE